MSRSPLVRLIRDDQKKAQQEQVGDNNEFENVKQVFKSVSFVVRVLGHEFFYTWVSGITAVITEPGR